MRHRLFHCSMKLLGLGLALTAAPFALGARLVLWVLDRRREEEHEL